MRLVVQRVSSAAVRVDGVVVGAIDRLGLVVEYPDLFRRVADA